MICQFRFFAKVVTYAGLIQFFWAAETFAMCSINLQLETCEARKTQFNAVTGVTEVLDHRLLIPAFLNSMLDSPVVHQKREQCFALADIIHRLCKAKEPTLASFLPAVPEKIDDASVTVIGESSDSRFTLIPTNAEMEVFFRSETTDANFLLSQLPTTSVIAPANQFVDQLRPKSILGGATCTTIGEDVLDGNASCAGWSKFADVVSRNSTELLVLRKPKSTVTLTEKLCSESTSCFSGQVPILIQRSNAVLSYLREVEQIVPRANAGFSAPTAVTMLLLGLKGENPGAIYGNSFDQRSQSYKDPASGKTYWGHARQIVEVISAMGTDIVSGLTTNEALYKSLEVFGDRITVFSDYTNDGIISKLKSLRTPFGFIPISKSGLDANHALVINGFSGKYLRIYDPWGRVYLVNTTVRDLPNQRVLSLLSQKPSWQMYGDFQNVTLLSYFGNLVTFSGPDALDSANSFLLAAARRGFADFALERKYLESKAVLVKDAVVLNHISGSNGYVYAQGAEPVYFKKNEERLFESLRDGDYWDSLRNKIVEDYLNPDSTHMLRGLIRTYRNGDLSVAEFLSLQQDLNNGATLSSIRLKLLGDTSVKESLFRRAVRAQIYKYAESVRQLRTSQYEDDLVIAMLNGRTWEQTLQVISAFDNFVKTVTGIGEHGGVRYTAEDFKKFYEEIQASGSVNEVNNNISGFLDQLLTSPSSIFALCRANARHLGLAFKEYIGRDVTSSEFDSWCRRVVDANSASRLAQAFQGRSIFLSYFTSAAKISHLSESDPEGARLLFETPEFRALMKASSESCVAEGKVGAFSRVDSGFTKDLVSNFIVRTVSPSAFGISRNSSSFDLISIPGVSVSMTTPSLIPGATQAMSDSVSTDRIKSLIVDRNRASIKFATTKYKQATITFTGVSHLLSESENHQFEDVYWMELFKDEKGSGFIVSGMGKNYGSSRNSVPLIRRTDKYYFACQGSIPALKISGETASYVHPEINQDDGSTITHENVDIKISHLAPSLWKHHRLYGVAAYRVDGALDSKEGWTLASYETSDQIFLGQTSYTQEIYYRKFYYPGQQIQYVLRPLVFDKRFDSVVQIVPDDESLATRAKVTLPPPGRAFISRRSLNFIGCSRMELGVDFNQHNRCSYAGPGNKNGFLDFEKNFFVDQFEVGCKESSAVKYGPSGCLKDGKHLEEYARVHSWLDNVGSSEPGLYPITRISAPVAEQICKTRSVQVDDEGTLVSGRLPSMAEWRTLSYLQLPVAEPSRGATATRDVPSEYAREMICHTEENFETPITSIHLSDKSPQRTPLHPCSFPVNPERTQWVFESPLGLRGLGTNVSEWVSDSVMFSSNCDNFSSHVGIASLVNPLNKDLEGVQFGRSDEIYGDLPYPNVNVRQNTHFHPLFGIPRSAAHEAWIGSKALDLSRTPISQESFSISGGTCSLLRSQIAVGGSYKAPSRVGVYNTRDLTWGQTAEDVGFRCVFPVD